MANQSQTAKNSKTHGGDALLQIIPDRIPDRKITYACQRIYERSYYLITLSIGLEFADLRHAHPQAHAVMDDFGTLRITREFL